PGGGEMIDVIAHPDLAPGTIFAPCMKLPEWYQSNEVPNTAEVITRRDYYRIDWPLRTRRREYGIYAEEVLAVYAPFALGLRTSRQILSYLRRATILPHTVIEIRDGTASQSLMLREWPVLSVWSLTIGAQTIAPASTDTSAGFLLEPWNGVPPGRAQTLSLNG